MWRPGARGLAEPPCDGGRPRPAPAGRAGTAWRGRFPLGPQPGPRPEHARLDAARGCFSGLGRGPPCGRRRRRRQATLGGATPGEPGRRVWRAQPEGLLHGGGAWSGLRETRRVSNPGCVLSAWAGMWRGPRGSLSGARVSADTGPGVGLRAGLGHSLDPLATLGSGKLCLPAVRRKLG